MERTTCYKCFHEYEGSGPCPYCGHDQTQDAGKYPLVLKGGSILGGRYIVGRVLGQGGFGVTYSAQDYDSKSLVAIKEHFPASIVTRVGPSSVQLISENMRESFLEGKQNFLNEAKTLSQFNGLPNICDIYSYFEENGTAYFAMEYVDGIPLDKYLQRLGRHLDFEEALRLMLPVMKALSHVHAAGIIHRDLSPDNIMVTPYNGVMLIDFGAARYSMGEKSRSLDVILKHGFAPREQYARHGRQGAYTDVYALAATFYYAITGKVPPDAIDRTQLDELVPPSRLGVKIPHRAEQTLLKALAVDYTQRFQSMDEFMQKMSAFLPDKKKEEEARKAAERKAQQEKREAERKAQEEKHAAERKAKEEQKAAAEKAKAEARAPKAEKTEKATKPRKKAPLALIAAIATVAIGAGALFAMVGEDKEPVPTVSPTPVINYLAQGEVVPGIEWRLSEDGSMTISGEGQIPDYFNTRERPWHEHKNGIKDLAIEDGITYIGANAFKSASDLKSVSIPGSVTGISSGAFENCDALETVTISEGSALDIAGQAFYGCGSLSSITLPDNVTSIGIEAFYSCSSLSSISIPGSVSSISGRAFYNCNALNSITLSEGTEHIQEDAFSGCDSLSKVNLPNGLKTIGSGAFTACRALENLTVPEGVSHISDFAFQFCSALRTITLPGSIKSIGINAFNNCKALETINYTGTEAQWDTVRINEGYGGNNLDKAKINFISAAGECGENVSWMLSNDGTLTISGSGEMADLDTDRRPWGDPDKIHRLVIEEGVTSVGYYAFYGLRKLESVILPESITSIGHGAFNSCDSLNSILLPNKLTNIGGWAFQYCASLSNISIPDSVTNIGPGAFRNCSSLKNVTLPGDITDIGNSAFHATRLDTVDFNGTEQQWNAIKIGENNEPLLNATVHFSE